MDQLVQLLERNENHIKQMDGDFESVQDGQWPDAVTVSCSDSRVLQDHMVGNEEPGHVFTVGVIGNRVVQQTDEGRAISGDVLYPIAHAGTDLALVIGHTSCGAVTATYKHLTEGIDEPAGIEHCIDLLAGDLEDGIDALSDGLDEDEAINRLVEYNVDRQVQSLVESDEIPDDVDVIGLVYDFQDVYGGERGRLHVININGDRDVQRLRDRHPVLADRIGRLWER